jgi:type IV pilus assembly protein PilB
VTQPRIRIGDMLVRAGLLTQEQLDEALAVQRDRPGCRLGDVLLELGFVDEAQLTQTLSNQLSVPWVNLAHVDFTRALLNHVPQHLAEEYCLIPVYVRHVRKTGDTLFVAMDDPTDEAALATVSEAAGMPTRPMVAAPSEIATAIRVYYGGTVKRRLPRRSRASSPGVEADEPTPPTGTAPTGPRSPSTPPATQTAPAAGPSPATPPPATPPPATPPPAAPAEPTPPTILAPAAAVPTPAPATNAPTVSSPTVLAPTHVQPVSPPAARAARHPRMITLTLLDGTTVTLPAPTQRARGGGPPDADEPGAAQDALTAADLVSALRAKAAGADVSDVLGNATWESMFAALLSVLLKKRLIADFEFVDEWRKYR